MNANTDATHLQLPERQAIEGGVMLPITLLQPNPYNRKRYDAAKMADLVASVRKVGVMQPIVARPIEGAAAGQPLYEIVAGERRWRASQEAGLATIPALLRTLTDLELMELLLVENKEREDMSELDEALVLDKMLRKPDQLQGYANADELAAKIGRSRAYVYQRLKLLALGEKGREALTSGKLGAAIALKVARLQPADQDKAVAHILKGWGGEALTYREANDYIDRTFHLDLSRAVFKIADAGLLPEAGSCTDCPKRSGAQPDLFTDIKKGDTCTDGACYERKEAAHHAAVKAAAEARGVEVIAGAQAKKLAPKYSSGSPKGLLELDKVHHELGDKPLRKLLGKKLPEVVMWEHPETKALVECVRQAEALAMLKENGTLKQAKMPTSSASTRDAERKAKEETEWRMAVAQQCVEQAGANAGADAGYRAALLTELALAHWNRLGSDDEKRAERLLGWEHIGSDYTDKANGKRKADRIRGLTDGQLCQLFTVLVIAGQVHVGPGSTGGKPERLLALAERLQVDAEGTRQELRNQRLQRVKAASQPTKFPAWATDPNPARALATLRAEKAAKVTPETALAAALKEASSKPAKPKKAAAAKKATKATAAAAKPPKARYVDQATGSTWNGRGLQPKWLKVALEGGATLADFDTLPPTEKPAKAVLSAAAADPFRAP